MREETRKLFKQMLNVDEVPQEIVELFDTCKKMGDVIDMVIPEPKLFLSLGAFMAAIHRVYGQPTPRSCAKTETVAQVDAIEKVIDVQETEKKEPSTSRKRRLKKRKPAETK